MWLPSPIGAWIMLARLIKSKAASIVKILQMLTSWWRRSGREKFSPHCAFNHVWAGEMKPWTPLRSNLFMRMRQASWKVLCHSALCSLLVARISKPQVSNFFPLRFRFSGASCTGLDISRDSRCCCVFLRSTRSTSKQEIERWSGGFSVPAAAKTNTRCAIA